MTDTMDRLKHALEVGKRRPLGQADDSPFRVGQVSSVDGIIDVPPTVTLGDGDLATQARLGMNIWDVNPYDTVVYITTAKGVPVVISRLPGVGSASLLPEDVDDEPEPWKVVGVDVPYTAGWANFTDPAYLTPRFRKQSDGWVTIEGMARRVSGSSVVMFTLPEEYRPSQNHFFTILSNNTYALGFVETNGSVRTVAGFGGDSTVWTSFSGVTFPTKVNPAAFIYPIAEGRWSGQEGIAHESPWAFLRSDGWVWWNGFLRNTEAPPSSPITLLRTDGKITCAPSCEMIGVVNNGGNGSRIDVGGNSDAGARGPGRMVWQNPNALLININVGGMNYWGTVGHRQPWIPMPFQFGHSNFGLDHQNPEYFRDAHGKVHLRGLVRRTSATGTTVATLPPGYRPSGRLIFATVQSSPAMGRIDVTPDGQVIATMNPSAWVSLTGIQYSAEL